MNPDLRPRTQRLTSAPHWPLVDTLEKGGGISEGSGGAIGTFVFFLLYIALWLSSFIHSANISESLCVPGAVPKAEGTVGGNL